MKEADFGVIVVGGGHAGCEAALACARMGIFTLLVSISLERIGHMSCNPAIGGLAKGHLVKEISALGGEMARVIDKAGIQFRRLNTRKGPAVRATRAQADRAVYKEVMKNTILSQPNLKVKQGVVTELLVQEKNKKKLIKGVRLSSGEEFLCQCVILAPGTFLSGKMHIGLRSFSGGREGDPPSVELSQNLKSLGFSLGRLKTGTCPRLDGRTIDFKAMKLQKGDEPPPFFDDETQNVSLPQIPCHITYTTQTTHEIIRQGLSRSPLYTGIIKGIGPRYCPSVEDKVMRFPHKKSHQLFVEPEGIDTFQVYPNGLSTSLPFDIQERMIHSIPGFERARILRPGYAIEYDFVHPTQLFPTLESKEIDGLFLAGQINGTSGYEEAGAQGLMAGINASLKLKQEDQIILSRDQAYIGVMIDDLVTKGTDEPYRMFTSRAEFRLLLREDNAKDRLIEIGRKIGLVPEERYLKFLKRQRLIKEIEQRLGEKRIAVNASTNEYLINKVNTSPLQRSISLEEILKRPEVIFSDLIFFDPFLKEIPYDVASEIEVRIKYRGYLKRQAEEVRRIQKSEALHFPVGFDFNKVHGLSTEVREKLSRIQPLTLGQAKRIPGITPGAISALLISLKASSKKRG
jgi:tRNA uridine 5-carboxymethylaminomethyl modification enzyme